MLHRTWGVSFRKQERVPVSPLARVSRKTISSMLHGKGQERGQPLPKIMAGAITSRIEKWGWGQVREYRNGLMRPEIAHYLIKITAELAEILGIALDEGK
jgi:hypothetical protein